MRARLAILESGVQVELREVVLRDKPPELLEASPKATVPVLVLPNGTVIDQSIDIMKWALDQHDPNEWLRSLSEELVHENDTIFKQNLDRYKYFQRHPELSKEEHREKGELFLRKLEASLSKSAYMGGDSIGFVDAAIFPFVRQFVFVDHDWFEVAGYVHLKNWLTTFLESDLFGAIMTKYQQWHAGDTMTTFSL